LTGAEDFSSSLLFDRLDKTKRGFKPQVSKFIYYFGCLFDLKPPVFWSVLLINFISHILGRNSMFIVVTILILYFLFVNTEIQKIMP
jgi:hypothetical protein